MSGYLLTGSRSIPQCGPVQAFARNLVPVDLLVKHPASKLQFRTGWTGNAALLDAIRESSPSVNAETARHVVELPMPKVDLKVA